MKTLKIGWLYQDLNPGGGQRVCREVSRIMAARGHDVTILVPRGRARDAKIEGAKILERGPRLKSPIASITASLPAMLLGIRGFDALLSSMPFMGIINALSPTKGLKYHWLQGDDIRLFDDGSLIKSKSLRSIYRQSAKISYRLPLKYWANSQWTKERFIHNGGKDARIINPGVNTAVFRPVNRPANPRPIIGTMGRRVKFKGMEDILAALNIVAEKGHDFSFRIISKDVIDFPENLHYQCELVSPSDDGALARLLSGCDIFISASWHEGFSLPPLEAMACGAAVVTTDSGGVREYARAGDNCLMVPPRSPELLAQRITQLLEDAKLRRRLAETGLRTSKNFTWERTVDKIEGIIAQDLEER